MTAHSRAPITGFTEAEHRAIERFLTARTVPLAYESGDSPGVRGTGSFYCDGEDTFLVTAAHVLEGIDATKLGIPDRPAGNVCIWHLDNIRIYHPKDAENFDVAIIRFLDPKFLTQVAANWECVHRSDVVDDSADIDDFLIAGYPAERVENKGGTLTPSPILQLFTKRYDEDGSPPRPDYDLLLRYQRSAKAIFGDQRPTPNLGGVSGALVYGKTSTERDVWSPESIFRPVGIQVSMKHDEYVRVKSWVLIHRLIEIVREQGI